MTGPALSRRSRIGRIRRFVAAGAVVVLLAAFAAVAAWGVQPATQTQTPTVESQSGDDWGWSDDQTTSSDDQSSGDQGTSGDQSSSQSGQSAEPPMSTHAS